MGFPMGWTISEDPSFSEYDLDSLRYHALGNAVTPPVAEWLANRIKSYLKVIKPLHYEQGGIQ
jgi:DNA (cytosine-5)-methyltransferase 1